MKLVYLQFKISAIFKVIIHKGESFRTQTFAAIVEISLSQ